jgi:hypothetical protein
VPHDSIYRAACCWMEIALQEDLQPPERDVLLPATKRQVHLGLAVGWRTKDVRNTKKRKVETPSFSVL